MTPTDLDFIDVKILEVLQSDGRASHSAIAQAVGLTQPSVHERVKKLEQRGVIKGYAALIDPEALGLAVVAFISVRLSDRCPSDMAALVREIPNVLEAHHVAGEDCLIAKVRVRSPAELEPILDQIWRRLPVAATKTTIAFSSYKETTALPLPIGQEETEERSA
jgi:Lrp/AsnC family leucine-responsive transcriptional regulator